MFKIYIDSSKRNIKTDILFKIESFGLPSETENCIETEIARVEGDIDIVSEIGNILKQNNLRIEDVGDFAFFPGPGSFTGLKTGSAIANVLNWAINKTPLDKLKYPEYGAEPNIQQKKF
jgi:tRNA A37 threonylcarbamoyltransferase TsaD